MDDQLAEKLQQAEQAVKEAESAGGQNSLELADKLTRYAALLRQVSSRKLEAVNVEARARAIRAKLYAAQEQAAGLPQPIIQPKVQATPGFSLYIGFLAVFMALSALFVNQLYLPWLSILSF